MGGDYRAGCCEKLLSASPVSNRANTRRLQDGPVVSEAEPITGGGGVCVITYLRRGKDLQWDRGVRICGRNNSADMKVNKEGEGGRAPGARVENPLLLMVKTMVRQAVSLQPMNVHGGADIHLQPMEDPTPEQADTPKGVCDPVESPHWSRLLARPVDPWREEPMLDQDCWKDLKYCVLLLFKL